MTAAAKVQTVAFFQASNEIIQRIPADSDCNICYCEPTEAVNGRVQNIFVHIFQAPTGEEYHWNHEYCLDQWIKAEIGHKREPACPLCRALISSEVLLPNIDTIVKLAKAIFKFDEVMRDPELTFGAMTSVILAISFGGVFHLKAVESQIKSTKALRSPALYSAIIRQSMTEGGKLGGSLISAVVCAVLGRELAKMIQKKQNQANAKEPIGAAQAALAAIPTGVVAGGLVIAGVVALASFLRKNPVNKRDTFNIVTSIAGTALAAGSAGLALGAVSTKIIP